jgi:DNA-binding response OmpR family regulator
VKKYHIIVAEDEKHICRTLLLILRKAGYRVTVFENGQTALQKILDNTMTFEKFDLLITDLQMPKLSGVELIRELEKRNTAIPIIMITGYADKKEYTTIGAHMECIEKPFEPQELLDRVAYMLEEHGTLQVTEKALLYNSSALD